MDYVMEFELRLRPEYDFQVIAPDGVWNNLRTVRHCNIVRTDLRNYGTEAYIFAEGELSYHRSAPKYWSQNAIRLHISAFS